LDFQKGGKWAVAYLETAGEFSPGNRDYYLATACGSIWLAPSGDVNLVGMRAEPPFFRGTLDLLGIVPDMDHIGKYKSAMNTYTDKEMNEPFRESMEALVGSIFGQLKRGIAKGRRMTEEQVALLIDAGPYVGPRALQAKLVDALGYRDELETSLKERNGVSPPPAAAAAQRGATRLGPSPRPAPPRSASGPASWSPARSAARSGSLSTRCSGAATRPYSRPARSTPPRSARSSRAGSIASTRISWARRPRGAARPTTRFTPWRRGGSGRERTRCGSVWWTSSGG